MTEERYCKRGCPIKEKGFCEPKKCHSVSPESPLARKALDALPLEFAQYIRSESVFLECNGLLWITLRSDDAWERAELIRVAKKIPRAVQIKVDDNGPDYIR